MSATTFQRARTDAQRDERREHILAVARDLLAERRVAELGLNELARNVGLAKSSLLGYFGSREAVLLELTRREYTSWMDEVQAAPVPRTTDSLARRLAETAIARPLLADLLSNLMTTLEHNVTGLEIVQFKLAMYHQLDRLQHLIDQATGPLPEEQRSALVPGIHALVNEFHALAHPSAALRRAATLDPTIRCGLTDHLASLTAALTVYLNGARATL